MTLVGLESRSTMLPLPASFALACGVIATPTSAVQARSVVRVPSPSWRQFPFSCSGPISAFVFGFASRDNRPTARLALDCCRGQGMSPVIIIVRIPSREDDLKRFANAAFTRSVSSDCSVKNPEICRDQQRRCPRISRRARRVPALPLEHTCPFRG